MTEIYWEFYISFAAASLSDVVKNPVHNGAKSIMKSYLYIYYSYTQQFHELFLYLSVYVSVSTIVFRFKHVRFKEDFQFKQDFTLPKMKE